MYLFNILTSCCMAIVFILMLIFAYVILRFYKVEFFEKRLTIIDKLVLQFFIKKANSTDYCEFVNVYNINKYYLLEIKDETLGKILYEKKDELYDIEYKIEELGFFVDKKEVKYIFYLLDDQNNEYEPNEQVDHFFNNYKRCNEAFYDFILSSNNVFVDYEKLFFGCIDGAERSFVTIYLTSLSSKKYSESINKFVSRVKEYIFSNYNIKRDQIDYDCSLYANKAIIKNNVLRLLLAILKYESTSKEIHDVEELLNKASEIAKLDDDSFF